MTTNKSAEKSLQTGRPRVARRLLSGILKILLSVAIVGAAVVIYRHQIKTSPRAGRRKPPARPKLVQVMPVHKDDCQTTVAGYGKVMPAQQVTLRPQVTGQIVEVSPDVVPGGFVAAGHKLAAIDHRDYDILVRQRGSDVARAVKDFKVEQGNQAIAKKEYELLGELITEEDRELVLREPQLASAQAAKESAEAALQKAKLDLARCDIAAPFNAIVQDKHVDLGATVSLNSDMVTLIGTDEAWIDVKVDIQELKWLDIPQKNSDSGPEVKISNSLAWGPDRFRMGRVLRLVGELETHGQQARLLVMVDDPLCLKAENQGLPQLLMDSYVSAEIQGRTLRSVFPIDWPHLRDNDTVWIMNEDNQLDIRPVQIALRGPERVYVTEGIAEDERLVVTDIGAPVAGMPLRIGVAKEQSDNQGHGLATSQEQQPSREGESQ